MWSQGWQTTHLISLCKHIRWRAVDPGMSLSLAHACIWSIEWGWSIWCIKWTWSSVSMMPSLHPLLNCSHYMICCQQLWGLSSFTNTDSCWPIPVVATPQSGTFAQALTYKPEGHCLSLATALLLICAVHNGQKQNAASKPVEITLSLMYIFKTFCWIRSATFLLGMYSRPVSSTSHAPACTCSCNSLNDTQNSSPSVRSKYIQLWAQPFCDALHAKWQIRWSRRRQAKPPFFNMLQPPFVGVEYVWPTAAVPVAIMLHNTFCKNFDTQCIHCDTHFLINCVWMHFDHACYRMC